MTRRSIGFSLRSSLWLIPILSLVMSAIAALLLIQLDLRFDVHLRRYWPTFIWAEPDGARQVLSAIASSMITVAGVVFSITMVVLSLSANQYGPRVLRNFMRDRLNQWVLGVFIGAFVYSLLVLQAVSSAATTFVPQLALWAGVALALLAIIFLIAFIHHTAISIQVSEIVAHIAAETIAALTALKEISAAGGTTVPLQPRAAELSRWRPIESDQTGFIQDVDVEKLFALACARDIVLRIECPVGDFVMTGRPLVSVCGAIDLDERFKQQIQRLFGISSFRTIEQDPEFGIRQIVDIALRALSPGINDTSTAINCLDYLGAILHCALQIKPLPETHLAESALRLVLSPLRPAHLVDVALNEIRQNASGNVSILLRMLRLLRELLEDVKEPQLRATLRKHAHLIGQMAEKTVLIETDLEVVRRALARALAV